MNSTPPITPHGAYSKNIRGRLTPEQVRAIRNSKEPLKRLASHYKMSMTAIKDIRDGLMYKWVSE